MAKKKTIRRRNGAGKMQFVEEVVSYGDAQVFAVDGVASIERVSANRIRVGFFVRNTVGGEKENKIVAYLDWDRDVYIHLFKVYAAAEQTVVRPDFPITNPLRTTN